MVISNQHNFVYLRIPKNASTSLATFFVKNCCNNNDRYTRINDSGQRDTNIPQKFLNDFKKDYVFMHSPLYSLVKYGIVTREELEEKQVIGVIRNPLIRNLSLYFFLAKRGKRAHRPNPAYFREVFATGWHREDLNNKVPQSDYFLIEPKGKMAPNTLIWNYDNLDQELQKFTKDNNIQVTEDLPTFKTGIRPQNDEELIEEYYDQKTKDAVMRYWQRDFELLEKL